MEAMGLSADFWRGKRVLVTGHTGFKGSWLTLWLQSLGAQVSGFSLDPSTEPSLFELAREVTDIAGRAQAGGDDLELGAVLRQLHHGAVVGEDGVEVPAAGADRGGLGEVEVAVAVGLPLGVMAQPLQHQAFSDLVGLRWRQ